MNPRIRSFVVGSRWYRNRFTAERQFYDSIQNIFALMNVYVLYGRPVSAMSSITSIRMSRILYTVCNGRLARIRLRSPSPFSALCFRIFDQLYFSALRLSCFPFEQLDISVENWKDKKRGIHLA